MRLTEQEAAALGMERRQGKPLAKRLGKTTVKRVKKNSAGEETLALQIMAEGLPEPVREKRFHPTRRWRFGFCFPAHAVAIEVDGSVYSNGRHTRGKGWEDDAVELAEAAILGWTVLRFSTGQVKSGVAIEFIKKLISGRKNQELRGENESAKREEIKT